MAIGMGDAIDNVSQKLREVDKQLSDSKDSFEEKVKDVSSFISMASNAAVCPMRV